MDWKHTGKKLLHVLGMVLLAAVIVIALLAMVGTVAHATGLVDDKVNASNLYSKYPLSNYQLDFYVDDGWSWLPWNWLDGIGKSVQYGLYCIANFVWTISLYLSNATGYLVQQAYQLDFINDMADSIGKSIQTIAGVTSDGFSSSGFYVGFLLLLILIVGIYVAYTGLIKRETSKAIHAVINFLVVFLISSAFIAYAPDYVKKVNDFSSDISTASLNLGTKIMLSDSDSKGKDSVDLIRDNLFAIQVQQPWRLLQFGNSDLKEIGADRVEALVSVSPSADDGKTREEIVKAEIEDKDNDNLTIPQVVNRLGMVFFLLIFNLGISVFVFLLTAMMIFSQILFIIFAMFLPVSFLLSMIPSYEGMAKRAIVKVFNTIMTRAGITLVVTVAFSISSMFYNISTDYPFFMVAFLQIVTFAGIYFKLGDIMSMLNINEESQNMGHRIFRKPYVFMRRRTRGMERRLTRTLRASSTAGAVAGSLFGVKNSESRQTKNQSDNIDNSSSNMGSRTGSVVGKVLDTKNHVRDKATATKESVKDMPTQAGYVVHSVKEKAKENVTGFKRGIVQEQETRQTARRVQLNQHRQSVAQKRMEIQQAQEARRSEIKADKHERISTTPQPEVRNSQQPEVKKRPTVSSSSQNSVNKEISVKERPVTPGTFQRNLEQSQSAQRQTTVKNHQIRQKQSKEKKGHRK